MAKRAGTSDDVDEPDAKRARVNEGGPNDQEIDSDSDAFDDTLPVVVMNSKSWAGAYPIGKPIEWLIPLKTPVGDHVSIPLDSDGDAPFPIQAKDMMGFLKAQGTPLTHVLDICEHQFVADDAWGPHVTVMRAPWRDVLTPEGQGNLKVMMKILRDWSQARDVRLERYSEDEEKNPTRVGIVSELGFNRAGYLIVRFLCEEFGWELGATLQAYAAVRSPGIWHRSLLQDLIDRFATQWDDLPLEAPPVPDWVVDENSEEDRALTLPKWNSRGKKIMPNVEKKSADDKNNASNGDSGDATNPTNGSDASKPPAEPSITKEEVVDLKTLVKWLKGLPEWEGPAELKDEKELESWAPGVPVDEEFVPYVVAGANALLQQAPDAPFTPPGRTKSELADGDADMVTWVPTIKRDVVLWYTLDGIWVMEGRSGVKAWWIPAKWMVYPHRKKERLVDRTIASALIVSDASPGGSNGARTMRLLLDDVMVMEGYLLAGTEPFGKRQRILDVELVKPRAAAVAKAPRKEVMRPRVRMWTSVNGSSVSKLEDIASKLIMSTVPSLPHSADSTQVAVRLSSSTPGPCPEENWAIELF